MTEITTHVLDLARGTPAAGVAVTLERGDAHGSYSRVGYATTDADGRVASFGPAPAAGEADSGAPVRHRLTFAVGAYFAAQGVACFHPEVQVVFDAAPGTPRCHVPLLVSPFGYSTYRGS
jgi:5-hydroxyisourate hydrolase